MCDTNSGIYTYLHIYISDIPLGDKLCNVENAPF